MTDRPIIFSAPMVRALLAGTKTQTRRILKPQPPDAPPARCHPSHASLHAAPYLDAYCGQPKTVSNPRGMSRDWHWWQVDDRPGPLAFRTPYAPSDRLWVREAWNIAFQNELAPGETIERTAAECAAANRGFACVVGDGVVYKATGAHSHPQHGKALWRPSIHMSRWASRLTLTVTDVRVQRLQEISEEDAIAEGVPADYGEHIHGPGGYRDIWEAINGTGSWAANPWVAAYTFTVQHANIDAVERRS